MLGELYKPRGLARETAQAVLEVDEPYAVNVALGCRNGCGFCYGPLATRQSRANWVEMRFPKLSPVALVGEQLWKLMESQVQPKGVFISFLTDPFLRETRSITEPLIRLLARWGIRVATLSKMGLTSGYFSHWPRHGMTLISLDTDFWEKWTPNVLGPRYTVGKLNTAHDEDHYTWVSMEPYPPTAIWKQDLTKLLQEINFVDLIVFGKWNYDKRANTEQAKIEYAQNIEILRDFCKSNGIRLHIKSDTLKFAVNGG